MSKIKRITIYAIIIIALLVALSLIIPTIVKNFRDGKADGSDLYNKYHYSFQSEKEAMEWEGGVGYAVFVIGDCDTYSAEILHDGSGKHYKHFASTTTRGEEYIKYKIKYNHKLEEILSKYNYDYTYNETVNIGGIEVQVYQSDGYLAFGFDYGENAYTVDINHANTLDKYLPALRAVIEDLKDIYMTYNIKPAE